MCEGCRFPDRPFTEQLVFVPPSTRDFKKVQSASRDDIPVIRESLFPGAGKLNQTVNIAQTLRAEAGDRFN